MCKEMPISAVGRFTHRSTHQAKAICSPYFDLALVEADFSGVKALAIDETLLARSQVNLTLAADAERRAMIIVTEGRGFEAVEELATALRGHGGNHEAINSASIDMSTAHIMGVTENPQNSRITFGRFHVVAHASTAIDKTRRIEQGTDSDLNGLRWTLKKDCAHLGGDRTRHHVHRDDD